jgi:16S rRNA (cytidine1402-2'-O)-methyltransferase
LIIALLLINKKNIVLTDSKKPTSHISGKLYLIPCPIAEDSVEYLPAMLPGLLQSLKSFVCERTRTSRRFIRSVSSEIDIDAMEFYELNKHGENEDLEEFLSVLKSGSDIGLISEAGMPGIADPGSEAVRWCHRNGVPVHPIPGPSSIFLALSASGFNGQQFSFHGYLPNKKPELRNSLKELKREALKTGASQIFMDAPYRNGFLLDTCKEALEASTMLCIASDLTGSNENIKTMNMKSWKAVSSDKYHKIPAIFIIGR